MTNRLKDETSPYLLQHQHNPVYWLAWNAQALSEAKSADKPILLSIGYAACHWCHVMAHECFDDPAIAQIINDHFIPIKVDREERPDLDAIYQKALSLMGQNGGWPLTMFLTPQGEPFYGGTYFPPVARWGRSSFPDVLKAVRDAWDKRHDQLMLDVKPLLAQLRTNPKGKSPTPVTLDGLEFYATRMVSAIDPVYGGIEGAPKFLHFGFFDRLWRAGLKPGNRELKDAVTLTLDKMFKGGVYDQLGGGLMRYSTDEMWLVPHFEKMLYDNAQALELLTLVWQTDQNPFHAEKVDEIITWTLREMVGEQGGFAATLDADDADGEGYFYTWTKAEIDHVLDPEIARLFCLSYGISAKGNWQGRSILHRQDNSVREDILAQARRRLLQIRNLRTPPARDHKILADWNGMMIAAMAQASFVFNRPQWLDAAKTAYKAIKDHMALPDHRLAHSMCKGRVSTLGTLDDLVQMSRAALMLFEVTGRKKYLHDAQNWTLSAHLHHHDSENGGYFQNQFAEPDVIAWLKPVHDTAIPAANGILLELFAKLWSISGDEQWLDFAHDLSDFLGPMLSSNFPHMASTMAGVEQLLDPVIVEVSGSEDLLRVVAETPLPTRILIQHEGPVAAHVCRYGTCSDVVMDGEDLRRLLT